MNHSRFVSGAVRTPVAPSSGVCTHSTHLHLHLTPPIHCVHFFNFFFCLLTSLQFWLLSGNAAHAPFSRTMSKDCSPYGTIKGALLKIALLTFVGNFQEEDDEVAEKTTFFFFFPKHSCRNPFSLSLRSPSSSEPTCR